MDATIYVFVPWVGEDDHRVLDDAKNLLDGFAVTEGEGWPGYELEVYHSEAQISNLDEYAQEAIVHIPAVITAPDPEQAQDFLDFCTYNSHDLRGFID